MAQFRLSKKIASRLKIKKLASEAQEQGLPFYDDWLIDVFTVLKREIIVFVHVKSRIALSIPLYEVGGMENLFNTFRSLHTCMMHGCFEKTYKIYSNEVDAFFDFEQNLPKCYKVDDHSALTSLKQFKDVFKCYVKDVGYMGQDTCTNVSNYWTHIIIKNPYSDYDYTTPCGLFLEFVENSDYPNATPEYKDNIIQFPMKRD